MNRSAVLGYGLAVYALFLFTFCYMIGFVGNWVVPKSIDSGTPGSLWRALWVNPHMLALFAVQHTVMARLVFKKWWAKFMPEPIERATYVLLTSLLLLLLVWRWRPMPAVVWHVDNGALAGILHVVYFLGWGIVLYSTALIDHFDLFGVRQVLFYARGEEYTPVEFQLRSLYRGIRHPLMAGFLIAFWATPHMTAGHLLFAAVTTVYILIAIQIEERTLLTLHGDDYRQYRERVSMLIPFKGIAPADWAPTPPGGAEPVTAE